MDHINNYVKVWQKLSTPLFLHEDPSLFLTFLSISTSAWQWVVHMKTIAISKKGLFFSPKGTLFETNHMLIVTLEIS